MKKLISVVAIATLYGCGSSSSDAPDSIISDDTTTSIDGSTVDADTAQTPLEQPAATNPTPLAPVATTPVQQQLPGPCIDDNHDGWGWNGVESCQVEIIANDPASQPSETETTPILAVTAEPVVRFSDYTCQTLNGENRHNVRLFEDNSGDVQWDLHGDSVWVATQNAGTQTYDVTSAGLFGRNPEFDRTLDYVQNCQLDSDSNHDWLLVQLPGAPSLAPVSDQWTFDCSLDNDPSTAWTWILNTDNNVYDPAGEKTGTWRWFENGQLNIGPFGNPAPLIRFEDNNKDIILADSRGGDFGKCVADKPIRKAQLNARFDYPMFNCNINGDREFLVFAPNGSLLSQYAVVLGSYSSIGFNSYQFRGIQWSIDQGIMTGANNVQISEFCTQQTGKSLYTP